MGESWPSCCISWKKTQVLERQEIRTEKSLRMTKRISKKFSKFPQHLPPNVWKADVHWVSDEVGVAVTPTWHLPKTYLNTYLRNEGQKMVVTIAWEKCRFSPREMPFLSKKSGTSPYSKCHFAVLKVPFSLPKCATYPAKCATFTVKPCYLRANLLPHKVGVEVGVR